MNNLIYIGNGILEQIKNFSYSYPTTITVEADSEEEARDLVESGDCNNNIEYCDYDTTDQIDIESIEEI